MARTPADLGIELYKAGDHEAAMPLLRQGLEQEPERGDLHMYLGMCWGKRDRWADALREFEKASDLDGANADYPFFAGVALMKLGREREAHSMFHVALLNNPQHPQAKAAWEQTQGAASEVTKAGSSAALPGGLAGLDITSMDLSAFGGGTGKPAGGAAPADDVAAAAEAFRASREAETTKKKGCGLGIVSLFGLLSLFVALLSVLF